MPKGNIKISFIVLILENSIPEHCPIVLNIIMVHYFQIVTASGFWFLSSHYGNLLTQKALVKQWVLRQSFDVILKNLQTLLLNRIPT